MHFYKLLIGGKDIDTGVYEYLPYADKAISDFKKTRRIILLLKQDRDAASELGIDVDEYIFARYSAGDETSNKQAIEAAYKASQIFKHFPVSVRKNILNDIHKNLLEKKEELLKLFVIEGHPYKLAEWEFSGMEKVVEEDAVNFFKSALWGIAGITNEERAYISRRPDGVLCVCPPKNAAASNSMIAVLALLAGNTIIIKPPLHLPISTIYLWREIIWKAVKDNGGPDGVINIVLGNSKVIMDEWLASPFVNDVLFFGPSDKGLEMGQAIYSAGKKPILELSGSDFLVVWKDADLEKTVTALKDAFLGSTQICMVPKAALIHADVFKKFSGMFVDEVKKMKVGLPSSPDTCLTPVLKIKEFYEFLDDALIKGAHVFHGGSRIDYNGEDKEDGAYITPTAIGIDYGEGNIWDFKCVREENFFPLLPLICVSGKSDEDIFNKIVNTINCNEYGLRVSVWVRSAFYLRRFVKFIDNSGLLRINSRHVGFSPFLSTHGGTRKTGGPYGEMNYIWQKTTHLQGITIAR
ncbi:succinate-semialdehyde dehydrogenase [Candidatus Omnitrophus magneticus]|uniref:Succinate-semialdehyde dehydrogenase n=1 Tax=Candidatus Omnitrophus magneticus TaxID=1609969 RepID=A0A0F0CS80_9BACT|nr:succinate-semialdehyde dehydrogenase [Candidatus Omnitrophus magneticus]